MDISGEYRIPAPRERVYAALNDPEVLRACIPGCRSLDKVSDTEFTSTVAAKVGPVSATFRGNVVLSDLDPPRGYTISGQGQGGAAGFARMSAKVMLDEDNGATVLRYEARADVGGKLASVGSRLVQGVAKKNADDFFSAFARTLGGVAEAAAAPTPESVTPPAPGAGPASAMPAAIAARPAPAPAQTAAGAPSPWIVALVSALCGVVLGFILGRW
jgi:carbon monoxide dehydrogenase subunit G